jgi:putative intracellular protease/amidase
MRNPDHIGPLEKEEIEVWGGGAPELMPDVTVSDVRAADFDAVIYECGQPLEMEQPEYLRLVRETVEQNRVLGALCMMPVLLGADGVLKGKQAQSNSQFQSLLKTFGAVVSDKDAVRDGKIVTCFFEGHEEFGWLVVDILRE